MATQSAEVKREDIIFDIYMYERELSSNESLSNDDIEILEDKIKEAEELFKSIK